MKWIVIWGILAALVCAGLIYTHAGPVSVLIAFLAWLGGVVSCLTLQTLGERRLHGG